MSIESSLRGAMRMLDRFNYKLINLKTLLIGRGIKGWRSLLHDEDWSFITQRDARVEAVCRGQKRAPSGIMLGEGTIHRGNYIPRRFPHFKFITPTRIAANVHPNCRCFLIWEDAAETIKQRIELEVLLFT